ncbi:hypothetical protein PInf_002521 [Phytophthora infestans]|nr:hypothetical protein PInf_002521 [Phytophthora infestans]
MTTLMTKLFGSDPTRILGNANLVSVNLGSDVVVDRDGLEALFLGASMERAMIPVNCNGNHWSSIMVDFTEHKLFYYDPMDLSYKVGLRAATQVIKSMVPSLQSRTGRVQPYTSTLGVQTDSYNCGIYILTTFEIFSGADSPGFVDKTNLQHLRYRYLTLPASSYPKHTGLLDYYACEYIEPEEEDSVIDELTKMLSRLHASDPMSMEELLDSPDESVNDDPTDKDFYKIEMEDVPASGKSTGDCEDRGGEEKNDDVALDSPDIKEHLKWMQSCLFEQINTKLRNEQSSVEPGSEASTRGMRQAIPSAVQAREAMLKGQENPAPKYEDLLVTSCEVTGPMEFDEDPEKKRFYDWQMVVLSHQDSYGSDLMLTMSSPILRAHGMVALITEFIEALAMDFALVGELIVRVKKTWNRIIRQSRQNLQGVTVIPNQDAAVKFLSLFPTQYWGFHWITAARTVPVSYAASNNPLDKCKAQVDEPKKKEASATTVMVGSIGIVNLTTRPTVPKEQRIEAKD